MNNQYNSRFLLNAMIVSLAILLIFGCADGSINVSNSIKIDSTNSDISSPVAQHYAEDTVPIEIELEKQTNFLLESISGDIKIEGLEDSNTIIINAQKRVGSFSITDAQNHLEDLQIEIAENDDEIVITSQHEDSSDEVIMEIHYSILVPSDMTITINNITGDIFLTDVQTDVMIDLVDGHIDAILPMQDDTAVQMAVVDGGIDLKIPSQVSAFLDASVINGSVEIMGLIVKPSEQMEDSLTGILGDGSGSINLHVVNGKINIEGMDLP
jgi:hypothetical protein